MKRTRLTRVAISFWFVGIFVFVLALLYCLPLRTKRLIIRPPRTFITTSGQSTLVVYAYFESDDTAKENLAFFLKAGYDKELNGVDYVIVVNGGKISIPLPEESPNLRVVSRPNTCFDSGAYAHVLTFIIPNAATKYSYFVFINSSVRGPFMPLYSYSKGGQHWTKALSWLITDSVKWAGTTINCAITPHVQTPVVITDAVGLSIVKEAGGFGCPKDFPEAIKRWEVGSSHAILNAGYNIGSLMTRYWGVDFREGLNAACNGGINPTTAFSNDGLNLDPFEVMFIKVKGTMSLPTDDFARRYKDYLFGKDDIVNTEYHSERVQNLFSEKHAAYLALAKRCGGKFDEDFYLNANKDLQSLPRNYLLEHWEKTGFREGRKHRFIADTSRGTSLSQIECAKLFVK